jgi:hypothetical protein
VSAIQFPPKRTRMRRRSGSAYNSFLGRGSATRNLPIAPGESGPCCHDNPISLLLDAATANCTAVAPKRNQRATPWRRRQKEEIARQPILLPHDSPGAPSVTASHRMPDLRPIFDSDGLQTRSRHTNSAMSRRCRTLPCEPGRFLETSHARRVCPTRHSAKNAIRQKRLQKLA